MKVNDMQSTRSPVLYDLDKSLTPNRYVNSQIIIGKDLVMGIK